MKEVLIRATSQRATGTCSEEVGLDDEGSDSLDGFAQKMAEPNTPESCAGLGVPQQARALSPSEPANRPAMNVDLPFRVVTLPPTILTVTTYSYYRYDDNAVSIKRRSGNTCDKCPSSRKKVK